jgi:hypothetical protein
MDVILRDLRTTVEALLVGAAGVLAIGRVIKVWADTRSVLPVLMALMLGAVALFVVTKHDWIRREVVGRDVERYRSGDGPYLPAPTEEERRGRTR